jgi:branched-chain amino acid transport system permease protein
MALAVSAVAGGFAGGFQALQLTYLDPQQFTIVTAVFYIAIMVVGGMRSVHGAIVGAAIFVLVPGCLAGLEYYMAFILFFFVTVMIVVMPDGLISIFSARDRISGWMASRHGKKNA